jgi:cell division protein FtsB
MRIVAVILGALIVLIQYPLWLGKGGWLRAWEVDRRVEVQRSKNRELEMRNAALAAEVRDLKTGSEAIEERARYELGMMRSDEVFYQFVPEKTPKPGSEPDLSAPSR